MRLFSGCFKILDYVEFDESFFLFFQKVLKLYLDKIKSISGTQRFECRQRHIARGRRFQNRLRLTKRRLKKRQLKKRHS